MKFLKTKVTVASALIVCVIGYSFWKMVSVDFFFLTIAISFSLFFEAILQLSKHRSLWLRKIAWIGFLLACNNLADELWFNPYKKSLNEYIAAVLVIAVVCIGNKKKHNNYYAWPRK